MLDQWWPTVYDVGLALCQQWVDMLCLLEYTHQCLVNWRSPSTIINIVYHIITDIINKDITPTNSSDMHTLQGPHLIHTQKE